MGKTIAVFIPMVFFVCVVLCVYFVSRFRYDAITKLGGPIPRSPQVKQSWKKVGIVIIGFATGLLLSGMAFLWRFFERSEWDSLFIVGLVSLCVGISMVIADATDKKEDENKGIDG